MALALATPAGAAAFDTGPHGDLTVDALRAEGFNPDAADVGRINNWFVDMYSNAGSYPYSGHADGLKVLLGGALGVPLARTSRIQHPETHIEGGSGM